MFFNDGGRNGITFGITQLLLPAFNVDPWVILEVLKWPADMLSQILNDKTQDVGMLYFLKAAYLRTLWIFVDSLSGNSLACIFVEWFGVDYPGCPVLQRRLKKRLLFTSRFLNFCQGTNDVTEVHRNNRTRKPNQTNLPPMSIIEWFSTF